MDKYVHVREYCTLTKGTIYPLAWIAVCYFIKGSPEPQRGNNSIPRFFCAFKFYQISNANEKVYFFPYSGMSC